MFDLSIFCDLSCDPGDLFTLKVAQDEAASPDVVDGVQLTAPTGPPQKLAPGTIVYAYRSLSKTVPSDLRRPFPGTVWRSHPSPTSPPDAVDGTYDILFDDGTQMTGIEWRMIRMPAPKSVEEPKEEPKVEPKVETKVETKVKAKVKAAKAKVKAKVKANHVMENASYGTDLGL